MWGNAFRNPDRSLLMSHLKCVRDDAGNAYCKRSYVSDCDVPALTTNYEELSDEVKEFLSKVPNLYVEDAAVCSGRLLETRVRSITNDPALALVMKNVLVLFVSPFHLASHAAAPPADASPSESHCGPWNGSSVYGHR